MKNLFSSLIACTILMVWMPSISLAQSDANALLSHYLDKRDSYNAIMSKVVLDSKLFNMDAPDLITANIEIVIAPHDTIFGAW